MLLFVRLRQQDIQSIRMFTCMTILQFHLMDGQFILLNSLVINQMLHHHQLLLPPLSFFMVTSVIWNQDFLSMVIIRPIFAAWQIHLREFIVFLETAHYMTPEEKFIRSK